MLQLFGSTYGTESLFALFSDKGFASAFLEFERALLDSQEELRLVPCGEAEKLAAICASDLDLASAGQSALDSGNPVLGLVDQVHARAPYAHYGVTAHDAWDVAHVLQLRDATTLIFQDVRAAAASLADLVEAFAETPMVGRTQGQAGAPTTVGFKLATWLDEMFRTAGRLERAGKDAFVITIAGAVGTGSSFAAMGGDPEQVERAVAKRLELGTTRTSWHTARDRLVEFASALGQLCTLAGKVGHEIYNLQRTSIGELAEGGASGSSSVPQKVNPWIAQRMHGLAVVGRGLSATVGAAASLPEGEREIGSAYAEWHGLAHLCLISGRLAADLVGMIARLEIHADVMQSNLDAHPSVLSESCSMILCQVVGKQRGHAMMKEAMARHAQGMPFQQAVIDVFEQVGLELPDDTLFSVGVPGWAPHRAREVAAVTRKWLEEGVAATTI
ncbi:lyase family protein [Halomonas urumqiensis]|uniref:lyase family protein n=1 Tax=Halomonas urumqiensis TaxID=1684789 RepID=UPI0015E1008B|nr:lyase family protein [Halomonas urumqiensis]GHE21100.1 3-carboxy-cis,cis-muconate cycloisomerase [Halomonas urumqiensis]